MDEFAWVAVAAAVISLAAVAVATWQATSAKAQAGEARRQADAAVRQTDLQEQIHRDASQPYVWADFRLDATQGSLLHLVVRNEGPTVAEDVRIVFDPPLQGVGVIRDLGTVHAQLAEGLLSMPPGREMRWNFAMGHKLFGEEGAEAPRRYTVTITGRGPYGEIPTLTYPLDLNEMHGMADPRRGSLDQVTKAIEKLAKRP
jgi:hypothetical protein